MPILCPLPCWGKKHSKSEKNKEKDLPYSKPSVFVGTHNYCILSWRLRPRWLLNIFFTLCLLGFSFPPFYLFFFSPFSRTRLALNTSFTTHTERFVLGPVQCAWVTVYQIRSRTQRERWSILPGPWPLVASVLTRTKNRVRRRVTVATATCSEPETEETSAGQQKIYKKWQISCAVNKHVFFFFLCVSHLKLTFVLTSLIGSGQIWSAS